MTRGPKVEMVETKNDYGYSLCRFRKAFGKWSNGFYKQT